MDGERVILNLGCGFKKMIGAINIDAFANCTPDVLWDLNETPWPFDDDSVDEIQAHHVFEHLTNWWGAFEECGRILKPGCDVEIRVPDASSDSALAYRDHHQIFHIFTFHGGMAHDGEPFRHGTNAWAATVAGSVPLKYVSWNQRPYKKYDWMRKWCPWLLTFCANHMRNFIWEQIFIFRKMDHNHA